MHVYPLLKLMLCCLIFIFVIVYVMQASGKVSAVDSTEVYTCHDFITVFLLFYLQEICL